jgi:maleylpyruvate isomerase
VLDTLHELSDAQVREPSLLPDWTRGHVLTHIARNADGVANLVRWAATGEEHPMYASFEQRKLDIEAGADRHAADHEGDIEASSERLMALMVDLPPEALDRPIRMASGAEIRGWELPYLRIREVEIHHVDLDAGYTPAHWQSGFVIRTLDVVSETFRAQGDAPVRLLRGTETGREWQVSEAGPSLSGPESGLLAWLVGRSDGDGLQADPPGPIPRAPRWS